MLEFEEYRPLLFYIAYEMLGSAMEAEDIVQETYLRYQAATNVEIAESLSDDNCHAAVPQSTGVGAGQARGISGDVAAGAAADWRSRQHR